MKKRMIALLAMIGLVLAAGTAVSVAAEAGEKNCDKSRAYGCDDHPGEHEDDGGEEPSVPELSCDALPATDPSLDEAVGQGCDAVTAALAGDDGGSDPGEGAPEAPEVPEPSCDEIPDVEPSLDPTVDGACATVAEALAG